MDIVICILMVICIGLVAAILFMVNKNKNVTELSKDDKKDILEGFNSSIGIINATISTAQKSGNEAIVDNIKIFQDNLSQNQRNFEQSLTKSNDAIINNIKIFQDSLSQNQKNLEQSLTKSNDALEKRILELIKQLDNRMTEMSKMQETKLDQIKSNTEKQIKSMQEDNNKQLDKMRETVDEKLSKTINERFEQSFKVLSTQLESVHKSLGEMQNVATNVGNLTKVLSNVKTTGVFGEVQLGAIFDQLLTPEQYDVNVVTGDAHDPVEYAIKMPGQNEGEYIYLPVDSKFPLTVYTDLCTAYENNEIDTVKQKRDQLKNTIKNMAKDIKEKYIYPPKTTDFAVMFLPIEGLYAEVSKMGLIEELQSKYKVTIAGPTTMSALLNSLQMGFRTLAISKKSGEVWKILGAVKTEFGKYNEVVNKIRTRFENTSKDFDALVGTRTRMIESKLKSVEKLDSTETQNLLGIADAEDNDNE